MPDSSTSYICNACGWIYDPLEGDPDGGIAPGTAWEDIPDDWFCPVCGASKDDFEPVAAPVQTAAEGDRAGTDNSRADVIIVGSGMAGYGLARELRALNAGIGIVVVTSDGGEVYTKPMLSNALARNQQADDLVQKHALLLESELQISIRPNTRVTAIDPQAHRLTTSSAGGNEKLGYDQLVLAIGADPRIFPADGSDVVGIATVNDLDDYRRWRSQIKAGERILLIGAGLIGCEFANDLAASGFKVEMVDPAAWPLARLLPQQIGGMLVEALEQVGCKLHLGHTVARYASAEAGFIAELDDGTQINFDHALSAVGLSPRTELAKTAGLEVRSGILVDRQLRTSAPDIYALGDCAETEAGPLPFIAPLLAEARALAATLNGQQTTLQLPAMPVVVKTPALPLVVCPPPDGPGSWKVTTQADGAVALYTDTDGNETGFALAGSATSQQQSLTQRMPALLPPLHDAAEESKGVDNPLPAGERHECDICGYIYDPAEGDPDGGIAPGTAWEDIPDDWVCPLCGAGKADFSPIG